MRDLDVIDGELRLITRAWLVARELKNHSPNTELIDQLLDERAAVTAAPHSASTVQPLRGNGVQDCG